jgi:glutamate-1-semialdehyde 2,1-aminomutase
VVLIFDEVITGFRYALGGAQAYFGVIPDLTTLAKILAGGLPGGAVAGKREIMQLLSHRGDPAWDGSARVAHAVTFNANPLSAVAGIATLEAIADGGLHARANKLGDELRSALSDVLKRVGAPGAVFGEASIYHVSFEGRPGLAGFDRPRRNDLYHLLRCALLTHGVDCSMFHGWVSAAHTEEDLALTIQAYARALGAMVADGCFKGI